MEGLDEVERLSLEHTIAQIERVIARDTASYGSSITSMLVRFVENAKQRVGTLDMQEEFAKEEKRKQDTQSLTIAHLVEREAALNQAEREQYGKFLEKEFFTKSDFGHLKQFYAETWDKLTDAGKDLMSMRIFEGVRRDEFKFSELPAEVKEKEAGRLHELMLKSRRSPEELGYISESDSIEFVRAHEIDKRTAYAVIERAFDQSLTKSSAPIPMAEETLQHHDEEEKLVNSEVAHKKSTAVEPRKSGGKGDVELGSDFLASLKEVDEEPVAIVTSIKADIPKTR